jgi:HSP20 family protein
MDLLKNKDLLRSLLRQSDLLNTINGGVSQTSVSMNKSAHGIVIRMSAPSVPVEAFNILLDYGQLTVFSEIHEQEEEGENKMRVPMFMKTFTIPCTVDTDKMEAFYESGELRILLPYKNQESLRRQLPISSI